MGDDEIHDLIEAIIRSNPDQSGFERVEVASGVDHDGEPALFITAHWGSSSAVDAQTAMGLVRTLRDALALKGEHRFPYVSHRYRDDVYPDEEQLPRRRARRRSHDR